MPTAAELLRFGLEATLASSGAILLVMALRRPLRQAIGARLAYLVWAVVPMAMLAVAVPGPLQGAMVPDLLMAVPQRLAAVTVGAATPVGGVAAASGGTLPTSTAWLLAWATGALLAAAWFAWQQRRFVARLGLSPVADAAGGVEGLRIHRARNGDGTPAVLGALRPRIVLPADFESRWSAREAALILAHERAHVARGDTRAQLLAVGLRCLFWFNPLVHLAMRAFRHDLELACDAAVVAAHPTSRRTYAAAMLKTQLAVPGLPVGCHWQSSQSLKERILMLKSPVPGTWRRRAGVLAVGCVLAGGSLCAWALQAPQESPGTLMRRVNFVDYPAWALVTQKDDRGFGISAGHVSSNDDTGKLAVALESGRPATIEPLPGAAARWKVELWGEGTGAAPVVRWRLGGEGVPGAEGRVPVAGGEVPLTIDVPGLPGGPLRLALVRGHDGGPKPQPSALLRDPDGAWRAPRGMVQGDRYDGSGEVVLLGELDAQGRVRDVRIESQSSPGLVTLDDARSMMARELYQLSGSEGLLEGLRVRQPMSIATAMDASDARVVASAGAGAQAPQAPGQGGSAGVATPAPPYPAKAAADGIGGTVLLHLLVATDGSVKDVKVAMSSPEGVFDQASIDAARKWKLQPKVEDGKAVESWVQVPITFSPDDPPAGGDASPDRVIDLSMSLSLDGVESGKPRVVVRDGEQFSVLVGEGADAVEFAFIARALANGRIALSGDIRRGGRTLSSPALVLRDGETGGIRIDAAPGVPAMALEVDARIGAGTARAAGFERG